MASDALQRNIIAVGPPIVRLAVHKSNAELTTAIQSYIDARREAAAAELTPDTTPETAASLSYKAWTAYQANTLYIPSIEFSGLAEERDQYDITVKLFYLPGASAKFYGEYAREAIDLVLQELQVSSVNLLIVSYSDVTFEAEEGHDVTGQPLPDCGEQPRLLDDDVPYTAGKTRSQDDQLHDHILAWRALETMHKTGTVEKLGVAEFNSNRLKHFIPRTRVPPRVDQVNLSDCCAVPQSLTDFAKAEGIELLTHNDCANILPSGTVRKLLGPSNAGAGILAPPHRSGAESLPSPPHMMKGEVKPLWVVKYTAIIKNRGVIENKGYFAAADLSEQSEPVKP